MIEIIQSTDKEFPATPNSGWLAGKFYLISGGRGIKRVWSPQCDDIPAFAWRLPGAPVKPDGAQSKSAAAAAVWAFDQTATVEAATILVGIRLDDSWPIRWFGCQANAQKWLDKKE